LLDPFLFTISSSLTQHYFSVSGFIQEDPCCFLCQHHTFQVNYTKAEFADSAYCFPI